MGVAQFLVTRIRGIEFCFGPMDRVYIQHKWLKAPRLSADQIASELEGNLRSTHVYFCGPTAMRKSLKTDLVSLGLPRNHFHYEAFEIRSGVGFQKVFRWLLKHYQKRMTN